MRKEASSNIAEVGETETFQIIDVTPDRLALKRTDDDGNQKVTTYHRISDKAPRRPAELESEPSGADAFAGRWVWDEDGTGDSVWLMIPRDSYATMQGEDSGRRSRSQSECAVADGKLALAFASEPMAAILSPDGKTLTGIITKREEIQIAFAKTKETPPPDADLNRLEDQALQMIAAVREKDDAKLTSCTLWISTTKPGSRTAHSRSRHPVNPFDFRRLPRTTRPGRGLIEIH